MLHRIAIILISLSNLSASYAEIRSYPIPDSPQAPPRSELYKVSIAQPNASIESEVLVSRARTTGPGSEYVQGRTVAWTDFDLSGTATVTVDYLGPDSIDPASVTIYPLRHNIQPKVSGSQIAFTLPGEGYYVLTAGDSGWDHALCIFANPLESAPATPSTPNTFSPDPGLHPDLATEIAGYQSLHFGPGVFELAGELTLPSSIKRVHLAAGAVVYGAFQVDHDEVTIDGRGLLSGAHFAHKEHHMIETPSRVRNTIVEGITIADFPFFAVRLLGHDSAIRNVKTVGPWVYNCDGFVAWARSTISDSFIMANDDAIKLYDSNVSVRDCVIWNLNNGACLQLGWSSLDAHDIYVDGIDVIRAEWRPESPAANNGIINLRLSSGGENIQSNLVFQNIRVDTPVLRIIDLRMDGMGPNRPANNHRLYNATFRNIEARMLEIPNNANNQNFIIPFDQTYGFKNLVFENLIINGIPITSKNATTDGRFVISPLSQNDVSFTD